MQTELEVLAEREFLTRASRGVAIAGNWPGLHRRRTAADSTLDAVPHHEVEAARVGTDDRLPALDRAMDRTRHQGQLLELVAAVGNARRQGVVLALVRKRFLVKRLENDLDLLLEQLATGFLVQHRRAEGLDLAGMVAAADAEDRPAAGQDVGGRKVLGQAQRMPHRRDVEGPADL